MPDTARESNPEHQRHQDTNRRRLSQGEVQFADHHTISTFEIIIYIVEANYKYGAYMQQTLGSMALPTVLLTSEEAESNNMIST